MSDIVYLFGAGINKGLVDERTNISPVLATDLFIQAFKNTSILKDSIDLDKLPLFVYINKHFNVDIDSLKCNSFDLEKLYKTLQEDIEKNKDNDFIRRKLELIKNDLTLLFIKVLSHFEFMAPFAIKKESFSLLGKKIYYEKSNVITFNYDLYLENVIEKVDTVLVLDHKKEKIARNKNTVDLLDEEISFSRFSWKRELSYAVKFDEITLKHPLSHHTIPKERYYSIPEHKFYENVFLKLHGSINWFECIDVNQFGEKKTNIILKDENFWNYELSKIKTENIAPIVITLEVDKNYKQWSIIDELWNKAHDVLKNCKTLVIGGYSFPQSDIKVKELFKESFKENRVNKIIVINPDESVLDRIKELINFNEIKHYKNLDEYVINQKLYLRIKDNIRIVRKGLEYKSYENIISSCLEYIKMYKKYKLENDELEIKLNNAFTNLNNLNDEYLESLCLETLNFLDEWALATIDDEEIQKIYNLEQNIMNNLN